jgi:hypothetical protein
MSTYLKSQGCKLVGFERSMWTVVKEGHVILITAHIDDFIIACADRKVLGELHSEPHLGICNYGDRIDCKKRKR